MSEELTLLPCPACGASDVVMRVEQEPTYSVLRAGCVALALQRPTQTMRSGNGTPCPAR